jgi:hypothetical protein
MEKLQGGIYIVKIIETNLSTDENNNIIDFQSRVIEVKSWISFVDEVTNAKTVTRNAAIGNMYGVTIPHSAKVKFVINDDNTLKCDVYNYCGVKTVKLAHLITEN